MAAVIGARIHVECPSGEVTGSPHAAMNTPASPAMIPDTAKDHRMLLGAVNRSTHLRVETRLSGQKVSRRHRSTPTSAAASNSPPISIPTVAHVSQEGSARSGRLRWGGTSGPAYERETGDT